MKFLQKIKEIATAIPRYCTEITMAIPKYCNKQRIRELFVESAKVSHESLQNQTSTIDSLPNTPGFMKEIYKADVLSKTLEGRALFADY